MILQLLILFLPWGIRRWLLTKLCHFDLHPSSRIGKSVILAKKVKLEAHASIGSGTICKKIDYLYLGQYSNIGNLNIITGWSAESNNVIHFKHVPNRKCELIIGTQSGITSRHYFDCTAGIYIGDFVQIAGHGTTLLTHSIDLIKARQDAAPIHIGNYCFIGIKSTILKGVDITNNVIVGACSLVTKDLTYENAMYGGNPAKLIKNLESCAFFSRTKGFI